MSVVDEIKARLDIVAYIGESVELKPAGRRFKAICPFHVERTPSFIVDPERGSWRCFGACAEGGDIFAFAMKRHGWSFREALEELARRAGVELRPRTPEQTEREQEQEALLALLAAMAEQYHEWLLQPRDGAAAEALRYAREQRQLSEATMSQFQVGYAPVGWQHSWEALRQLGYTEEQAIATGVCGRSETSGRIYDRFRARLMFPIFDTRGRVRGFGGRALDEGADAERPQAKYLNSPQGDLFDKSRLLYGLERARAAIRETGVAVVVEGYFDAIQAHQAGYHNVVAQMGTALTEPQLRLLLPGARVAEERRIVLALDADVAGQAATRRGLETARRVLTQDFGGRLGADIRILQLPLSAAGTPRDPDDVLREEPGRWAELVEGATPLPQYVIDQELAELPAEASIQQRESAARRILPLLLVTESDLQRRDHVQQLARRLHIQERDLLALSAGSEARAPRPNFAPPDQGPPPTIDFEAEGYGASTDEDALPRSDRGEAEGEASSLAHLEAGLLRILLREPHRLQEIDRMLWQISSQEISPHDEEGVESAKSTHQLYFGDFGGDDFSQNEYRAFITLLREALRAEEETFSYLQAQSEGVQLGAALTALMEDELDWLSGRLGYGLAEDLKLHRRRNPPDDVLAAEQERDLLCGALDLRRRRLGRMLDELYFLVEGETDVSEYAAMLAAWARARRLLDERLAKLRGQPG